MEIEYNYFANIFEENKEEAFVKIDEFFNRFTMQSAKETATLEDDEFYSSIHSLKRLIDSDRQPTTLYLYDRQVYCRGCEFNCGRYYNTLELHDLNEKKAEELFEVSKETTHELTRNFLVGLGIGGKRLEIRTWYENHPEKIRQARLRASDYYVYDVDSDFDKTLELVNKLRAKTK